MKKLFFSSFLFIILFLLPFLVLGENDFEPIVSIDWLKKNLNNPSVIVLDIRGVQEFKEAHIPGSVNLSYTAWRTIRDNLDCQLPLEDELNDTICSIGLQKYAHVVIVGKTDTDKDCVNMTRVAWTIKYAGIKSPGIFNGGFNNWVNSNLPTKSGWESREKGREKCKLNKSVVATKEHLKEVMGKAAIIDTRTENYFSGKEIDPRLKRKGHIPNAINLPYSLIFKKDGTFEDKTTLASLAYKTVGEDKDREIIVLCCNGQYSSSWWFVFSEVLGYKKVSIYDGSMEEWCKDGDSLVVEPDKK
ncbi:MAG TPA: rhodanese-like domain-containing protein [Syntrophorhabdaceae bacterium]|nr:rhodanese-like domain-containing protein [Syntrophorhabdaceae bacterium]